MRNLTLTHHTRPFSLLKNNSKLGKYITLVTLSSCLGISFNAYAKKSAIDETIENKTANNSQTKTISREVICRSDTDEVIIDGKDISTGVFQKDDALPDPQYLTYLSISSALRHNENFDRLLSWFKKQDVVNCKVNYIDNHNKIIQQTEFNNLNINNFGEQASRINNQQFETNNIFEFGGDNVVINIDTDIKDNEEKASKDTNKDKNKVDLILTDIVNCQIDDKSIEFKHVIDVGFNLNVNSSDKKRQIYFQFSAPLESRETYLLLVNLFKNKNQSLSCDLTYANKLNPKEIISKVRYKNLHITSLTEAVFEHMDEPFSTNIGLGNDDFDYEILPIELKPQ